MRGRWSRGTWRKQLPAGAAGSGYPDGRRGAAGIPVGLAGHCAAIRLPWASGQRRRCANGFAGLEVMAAHRQGVTSEESAEIKRLKRENAELRRANEILEGGLGFLRGGARPPTTVAREVHQRAQGPRFGVEPICRGADRARLPDRPVHATTTLSVGTVGDAYDNALAESVIGLFKTELIKPRGPWRTAEQVEIATLEYVDWFNHRRLYEACGDIPPAELEDRLLPSERRPHRGQPDNKLSLRTRRGDSGQSQRCSVPTRLEVRWHR